MLSTALSPTPSTRLKEAFLFLPSEPWSPLPVEVVLRLTATDIRLLQQRMALADRLSDRHGGPHGLLYHNPPVQVYYRILDRVQDALRSEPEFACSVSASFLNGFQRLRPSGLLSLHVQGGLVALSGGSGPYHWSTVEAVWTDLMHCRLLTAPGSTVAPTFRELANVYPPAALEIIEEGLVVHGAAAPARDIRPYLAPSDLVSLLEWPESDVRERAITALRSLHRAMNGDC